jgi:chitodextrinase
MHMKRAALAVFIIMMCAVFFPGCIFPAENMPPEPNLAVSSTFINVNEKILFSANDSVDRDGDIVRYFWDFGDGNNASQMYVTHDYIKGGNYTVILIITDNNGKKAIQSITIRVNEIPKPVIDISLPAYIHEVVYFEANRSVDPDGFITEYKWEFNDGTNDTGTNVTRIFSTNEWYTVRLTVTDNTGAKNATSLMFEVQNRTYKITWEESSYEVPHTASAGNNYTYEIEDPFGRGVVEYLLANITALNITHVIFEMTWNDDFHPIGDPNDEFVMNITSPTAEEYNGGPSKDESILLDLPEEGLMNNIPKSFEMEAESPEKLMSLIAPYYTNNTGTGDWIINITLLEAEGASPLPQDIDSGNSWELTATCYYYTPKIEKL